MSAWADRARSWAEVMRGRDGPGATALPRWTLPLAFGAGFFLALPFVLSVALGIYPSHDEAQHLAAGLHFGRGGLLPYRDFPYFHVPYLVYAYGGLFRVFDDPLLASRGLAVGCAAGICGLVFLAAWRLFASRPWGVRAAVGVGAVALLVCTHLFHDTVGRSWNQEPSVFLALGAFLCHEAALGRARRTWGLFGSGVLLGLAIGTRVTVAPLVLPFAVMLWLAGTGARDRWRDLAVFAGGLALALLPAAWACAVAPQGFIFGNVEFPKINIDYRMASGEPRTMTLPKKLRFFFKEVTRPDAVLFYGFVAAWLAAFVHAHRPLRACPRMFPFLLLTGPFLFLGAVAPSPAFDQYFFPLVPFVVLGIVCLLASVPPGARRARWMWGTAALAVLAAVGLVGRAEYDEVDEVWRPERWAITKRAREVAELRRLVPSGPVLTFEPTLPLAAGLSGYPQLTTGRFGWRIAPFVATERRRALRLVAEEDLAALLAADPPAAVLLGFQKRWEQPLAEWVRAQGFRRVEFTDEKQLWLAPGR